jgi:hypothetical protein
MVLDIWVFFENLQRKRKFYQNLKRITGTLLEDLYTSMIITRWIIFRFRNVLGKIIEKIKTHIFCSIIFSRKSYRLCDNVKIYSRDSHATYDNIIRHMRIACWINKAKKHKLRICNIIPFAMLRLYAHYLSCLYLRCGADVRTVSVTTWGRTVKLPFSKCHYAYQNKLYYIDKSQGRLFCSLMLIFWCWGLSALQPWRLLVLSPQWSSSFISRGAVHQAVWETSASKGRK